MKRSNVLLVTLALACMPALAGALPETFTERAPGAFDKAAAADRQAFVHRWLESERVATDAAASLRVDIGADALAELARPVAGERRLRVGTVASVDAQIRVGAPGGIGAMSRTPDGGFVWTSVIEVPGAAAVRLNIDSLALPAGTELYLYNDFGQVHGPYTGAGPQGTGNFWSHTVNGGRIHVQLRHFGQADRKTMAAAHFAITEVGVIGERFIKAMIERPADPFTKSFCSFNEPCIENASCSSIPSAIQPARDAIAHILFRSGGFFFICSGGLLTDTDSGTQIPHFLTANHCMSKSREASSLEAFFQYSTNCNGACYDPDGVVPSTLGSSIQATSRNSDFTLLRLDQAAPAGSAFLGWTATPVANSNGTDLFRISHPAGAPQAYSRDDVDTNAGTCSSLPRGNFIYSRGSFGGTEGGSSGAPVLNSGGQVVGQLFGACGTNVNDACDNASNATVDGAFAATFPSVAAFLDPGTSCTDNDGDGSCAGDDCDDNDASAFPGATEVCGDNVDNDCDGAVDEGCGVCMPKGASCTQNGDCCSNKCKGPSGGKTCK